MLLRATIAAALFLMMSNAAISQPQSPNRVTLMPMANTSKPTDLDFQGGTCDINAAGTEMTCAFQQVLIAPALDDPSTCRIVTNHYTQRFAKESERRWVSREGPDGACGTMTETSIDQDARSLVAFWRVTMSVRRRSTARAADRSRCAADDALETLTSTDVKRPLPCTAVVASSLEF
jgi:hypothetical protein